MTYPSEFTATREGILVIGAGELGASLLRALAQRQTRDADLRTVAVLLRPSAPTQATRARTDVAAKGIVIEEADVAAASVSELTAIMGRYHTVVSCVGFTAGPGTQRKLADAAIAARVPRFFPWQFGVDYDDIGRGSPQDLFDEQLDVRDALRSQSVTDWVIVSTGMFTSFLFEPSFGVVDLHTNTVHALGDWDTEVTVTTADDIGTLTAEIIHTQPRIANQVVYLAGDTITYRRLADIVEQAIGAPVTRTEWSIASLLDDLEDQPSDTMRKYRAVFAQGKGVAWPKDRTFNAIRGVPTTSAAEWARAHLPPR
jgi:hypothetical protein